jgi:pimeloyl-ACP methyl ester carboxylesterase
VPRNFAATGEMLPLQLSGAPFQTSYYCGPQPPKGIVILGTGDGGWSYWEENTAKHLSAQGYAVGGWDCRKFADSRQYDQAQLSAGFRAAVDAVRKRSGADEDAPVWYGGWSTGAEQSVAAACADRPPRLTGLLLAAPGSRGRYGITTSDLLGKEPRGPGSYAMADLAPGLQGLRVAQFAAGLDPLDDVNWLAKVSAPHRIFVLPGKLHDMGGAGPEFQQTLDKAIAWTLETTP